MNFTLLLASAITVGLGAAFFILFRNLASRNDRLAQPEDWANLFSPSRYKPMERLLGADDYRFLASQPGYNRKLARKLRTTRINIFRGYARCLGNDFNRVSNAIKMLMVHAPADRSTLAGQIMKQRMLFSMNMASIQFRLVLHSFGWSAPTVDVRNLVESLDTMCAQLRSLALTVQPSASAA